MTNGEREVYETTGRISMCCGNFPDMEQSLIEQLRRHWKHRNNGDTANINSRYFCYEAIYRLRYWRFHHKPDRPEVDQLTLF